MTRVSVRLISVIKTAGGNFVLVLVIQVGEATSSDVSHAVLNGLRCFDTPGQNNTERTRDTIIGAWIIK